MDTNAQIQALQEQVLKLSNDFSALSQAFYKNNFSSYQDFPKFSNFTTRLKVPSYSTLPTCEVGEIAEAAGQLWICAATNTWELVGTQN